MRDLSFFGNDSSDIGICENYANMGYMAQDASTDPSVDPSLPTDIAIPYDPNYYPSYPSYGYPSYGYGSPSPYYYTPPSPYGYPGYAAQVAQQPCPDGTWPSHDNSGALVCPSGPLPSPYPYGYAGGIPTGCPAGQQWVYNPATGGYVCGSVASPPVGTTPCAAGYVYTAYGCQPQQNYYYPPSSTPPLSQPTYPVGTLGTDAAADAAIGAALQSGQITLKSCSRRRVPPGQSQYRVCTFQIPGQRKTYNFATIYRMLASSGMMTPGMTVAGAGQAMIPSISAF